nr:MAG TPA: hypothetical protein [Caudoviricetes sp.]
MVNVINVHTWISYREKKQKQIIKRSVQKC